MIIAIKCYTKAERATTFMEMLGEFTVIGPSQIESPEFNYRGHETGTFSEVVQIVKRGEEEAFRATFRMSRNVLGRNGKAAASIEITFSGKIIPEDPVTMLRWLAACGVVSALVKTDVPTGFEDLFPIHDPNRYSETTPVEHLLKFAAPKEEEHVVAEEVQEKRVKK